MDVRSRAFTDDLASVIKELDASGYKPRVLFLEATDEVLIRRFEQVRRGHPMQGDGRLADGITAERALLAPLRNEADLVIETSTLSVHDLRAKIEEAFGTDAELRTRITLLSFGYKYGLPMDADVVMDVRFLPNPFWIPELRDFTGLDTEVRNYVLSQEGAEDFLQRYQDLLRLVGAGFRREGKRYLTLAVGCTGGKHRSVAISEELARRMSAEDDSAVVKVVHRDLGRE
jgi:RNase adapter protein RapZ